MQLEGIIHSGAPWGGPESIGFLSRFTSLVYKAKGYTGAEPFFCREEGHSCTRCGKCGEFEPYQLIHEQLYHRLMAVTGYGLVVHWPSSAKLVFTDEAIRRAAAWSGLACDIVEGGVAGGVADAVRASLERGLPALVWDGGEWRLITGFDAALYDEDGKAIETPLRAVVVTGEAPQSRDYRELFSYQAALLADSGELADTAYTGFEAHDRVLTILENEKMFSLIGRDELQIFYTQLHSFIGELAEGRCFTFMAYDRLLHDPDYFTGVRLAMARAIAALYNESHTLCWKAWAALGGDHRVEPLKYAEKLRNRKTRERLTAVLEKLRDIDVTVGDLLDNLPGTEMFGDC